MRADVSGNDDGGYRHPWLGVEVRHLATLIAVARTRSFRRAAGGLGYAPSVVSHQISELERVVGVRLVDRRHGGPRAALTPAGRLLLDHALRIMGELGAARADIAALADAGDPAVRLVVASGVAPLVSRVLPAAMDRLPDVRLHIAEAADAVELAAAIASGAADLGIGAPVSRPELASVTLLQDPFVVLVRRDSALARLSGVSAPEELAGQRVIVSASARGDACLAAGGLDLEPAAHAPIGSAIPPLVAAGAGIGLLPASEAIDAPAEVVALSTAALMPPRRVVLSWHAPRGRSAAVEAFCAVGRAAQARGVVARA